MLYGNYRTVGVKGLIFLLAEMHMFRVDTLVGLLYVGSGRVG